MLPYYLRVILVISAAAALLVVCRKVKKEKILFEDAVFWVVTAVILVILAIFPEIAIRVASTLGFMSASNFIYLCIIGLLLWKTFVNSAEISILKSKINELAQEIALSHSNDDK